MKGLQLPPPPLPAIAVPGFVISPHHRAHLLFCAIKENSAGFIKSLLPCAFYHLPWQKLQIPWFWWLELLENMILISWDPQRSASATLETTDWLFRGHNFPILYWRSNLVFEFHLKRETLWHVYCVRTLTHLLTKNRWYMDDILSTHRDYVLHSMQSKSRD